MEETKKFCEILRKRSAEHKKAISRLEDLPGMMLAILRQELDSMIRVIYLLSKKNISERTRLIQQTIKGEKWTELTTKGKLKKITNKEMVSVANKLQGWTQSVYKFGCAFIHLSNYHDYSSENPFDRLSTEEQKSILHHMQFYHGGPHDDNPSFNELSRYFPAIFQKINSNLECYIKDLEKS